MWTRLALELIVKYQQSPLRAARTLALLHASMHDAHFASAAVADDGVLNAIAVHRSAGEVLGHLYPQEPEGRLAGFGLARAASLIRAGTPAHKNADQHLRIGEAVAARAIARALSDGADARWHVAARPTLQAGQWRAAPPLNLYDPLEPLAGTWRPWLTGSSDLAASVPPPHAYGDAAWSGELMEVLATARRLGAADKAIAERWNLDRGTVTPAGVWNLIAMAELERANAPVGRTAAVLAAVNVAMADAFIACWQVKFKWWTERPITAIRDQLDANFLSHLLTPPFPSYVSGHATISGAAAVVLGAFFQARADWLRTQAEEAAHSRLLGGIHFRSDNDAGLALGRAIGEQVVGRVRETSRDQDAAR